MHVVWQAKTVKARRRLLLRSQPTRKAGVVGMVIEVQLRGAAVVEVDDVEEVLEVVEVEVVLDVDEVDVVVVVVVLLSWGTKLIFSTWLGAVVLMAR
jgi:hypothetical protein